jgi:phospholipid-binding lipoprotein MlaA
MNKAQTKFQSKHVFIAFILSIVLALTGCATGKNPEDPYESFNRKVFSFNMKVDKYVYKPIAQIYDHLTPMPIRKGVTNFFSNIGQLPIIANNLLQGNMEWFVSDIGRLIVNTTMGVGGLFDVATPLGIEKHQQDFGLTLAKWGFRDSPYLMLPFLPSSTPRDIIGFGADYFMSPWPYIENDWWTYAAYGIEFANARAAVLGADKLIEEAFDSYVFVRDAYMQRRQSQIQTILGQHGSNEFSDDLNADSGDELGFSDEGSAGEELDVADVDVMAAAAAG